MDWSSVGNWLTNNVGKSAALVGSLLAGNVPGAVAAGVSMVAGATGTTDPSKALISLQNDPSAMIKLQELANDKEAEIHHHIETITLAQLQAQQAEHSTTQETIKAGDRAEDKIVRWTRPGMAWIGLVGAMFYAFATDAPSLDILLAILALPYSYMGLREAGKGIRAIADAKMAIGKK